MRFPWSDNLCESIYHCFDVGPASRIFTKLLKIPQALLNMRLIIQLDSMLVFERTMEEALMSCQSVTYILQFGSFVKNLKEIEFLGMIINSREITYHFFARAKNRKYK